MPKSRGRKQKRAPRARGGSGDPRRKDIGESVPEPVLRAAADLAVAADGDLSDPLTLAALPALYLELVAARNRDVLPAERCVDDCLVLAHACAQLGTAAQVRVAELTVTDTVTGLREVHGSQEPWWEDGILHGHTVVWLPERGYLIDPTAEQYEEIAAWQEGPVITSAISYPGQRKHPDPAGQPLSITVPRGSLSLAYALGAHESSIAFLDHPVVLAERDGHLRRGANIASEVVALLASRRTADETIMLPSPRAAALIAAVRNLDEYRDNDGRLYFTTRSPQGSRPMRLDEIPLPAGTPPAPVT